MEMTNRRWVAALAITLSAVGIYFTRPNGRSPENPSGWDEGLFRAIRQQTTYDEAHRYAEVIRVLTIADSVRRPSQSGLRDSFELRIDAAMPVPLRARITSTIQSARTRLGIGPAYPITIVVVRDTVRTIRGLQVNRRGLLMSSMLPGSTGDPCLVLMQFRESASDLASRIDQWAKSRDQQSISFGICGFFGRFGAPGLGMSRWISNRWHDQVNPDVGTFERRFRPSLSKVRYFERLWSDRPDNRGIACGAGRLDACRDVALIDSTPWGRIRMHERLAGATGNFYWDEAEGYHTLGAEEPQYLADLARDLGQESFTKLWRSDEEISKAFATISGNDLAAWTRDWVVTWYGPQSSGATPSAYSLLGAIGIAGISVGVALGLAGRRRIA